MPYPLFSLKETSSKVKKAVWYLLRIVASQTASEGEQTQMGTLLSAHPPKNAEHQGLLSFLVASVTHFSYPLFRLPVPAIGKPQYRGDEFNRKIRPYAAARNDFTFEVLSRIHARSCVTMSAILTLLRTGHATDALARARTLHELYVTALFIREKSNGPQDGDALAERYLLYQDVEALKIAREYDKHYQKLAVAPLDPKTIPDLEAAVQTYKAKFSGQYDSKITKGSYGWATEKLGKLQPSFEDIENAVGVSHSRPYYKLSSYPVHAGPKGIFFDSGVSNTRNVLTAGPTNTGLADPAKMAINAFANCTNIMLGHTRYADEVELRVTYIQSVTTMHLMNTVSKTAIKAFAETQRELMQEEEEIQQQSGKKEHT